MAGKAVEVVTRAFILRDSHVPLAWLSPLEQKLKLEGIKVHTLSPARKDSTAVEPDVLTRAMKAARVRDRMGPKATKIVLISTGRNDIVATTLAQSKKNQDVSALVLVDAEILGHPDSARGISDTQRLNVLSVRIDDNLDEPNITREREFFSMAYPRRGRQSKSLQGLLEDPGILAHVAAVATKPSRRKRTHALFSRVYEGTRG